MKDIRTLHNEAMDLALQGDTTNEGDAQLFYTQAFEKEREAALLADFMQSPEPGRSILFRSAASLAMQCGKYREGEQLIAKALSGNPYEETAKELRQMLQDMYGTTDQDGNETVIYRLEVPDDQRKHFESYITNLGLHFSRLKKVIGNVALL